MPTMPRWHTISSPPTTGCATIPNPARPNCWPSCAGWCGPSGPEGRRAAGVRSPPPAAGPAPPRLTPPVLHACHHAPCPAACRPLPEPCPAGHRICRPGGPCDPGSDKDRIGAQGSTHEREAHGRLDHRQQEGRTEQGRQGIPFHSGFNEARDSEGPGRCIPRTRRQESGPDTARPQSRVQGHRHVSHGGIRRSGRQCSCRGQRPAARSRQLRRTSGREGLCERDGRAPRFRPRRPAGTVRPGQPQRPHAGADDAPASAAPRASPGR